MGRPVKRFASDMVLCMTQLNLSAHARSQKCGVCLHGVKVRETLNADGCCAGSEPAYRPRDGFVDQ